MTRICTICARGGSKGVKSKNIRDLLGKPLLAYSILQAKQTHLFESIAVSSDSKIILEAMPIGVPITSKEIQDSGVDLSTQKIANTIKRDLVLRFVDVEPRAGRGSNAVCIFTRRALGE